MFNKMINGRRVTLFQKQFNGHMYKVQAGKDGSIWCWWEYKGEAGRLYATKRLKMVKELLMVLKSNGCAICGYNKCSAALDFHHVTDREFSINAYTLSCLKKTNQEIADEIAKCILLCANCHREIHYNG